LPATAPSCPRTRSISASAYVGGVSPIPCTVIKATSAMAVSPEWLVERVGRICPPYEIDNANSVTPSTPPRTWSPGFKAATPAGVPVKIKGVWLFQ